MQDTKKVWKKFIVLEGLDGAGTTTQREALTKALNAKGIKAVSTCEPTGNPIGQFLRRCLKGEWSLQSETLAHLFAADRNEHLYGTDGISTLLKQGYHVVCDRYLFSSLAYQSLTIPFDRVLSINEPFPLPEHLFFLRIDPDLAMKRLEGRSEKEIFETRETQIRVADGYEKALFHYNNLSMNVWTVDATLSREAITEILLGKIFPV